MRNDKDNLIVTLTFDFALQTIAYCEVLEEQRRYVVARQLLKSSTSIGANVREAQNAESKTDFIHKMKIAAKEADESAYWLALCQAADAYPNCEHLIQHIESIIRVLSKIIATAKQKPIP
jgi:four helix bundle protein